MEHSAERNEGHAYARVESGQQPLKMLTLKRGSGAAREAAVVAVGCICRVAGYSGGEHWQQDRHDSSASFLRLIKFYVKRHLDQMPFSNATFSFSAPSSIQTMAIILSNITLFKFL